MSKRIIITVNPDGTTKHDFEGYLGAECLAAGDQLKALLAQLGIQVEQTNFIPKPELQHGQEQYLPTQQQQIEGGA